MTPEEFFERCDEKKPGCVPTLKRILKKNPGLRLQVLLDKKEPPFVIIAHFIYHENNGDRTYLQDLYEDLGGGFSPYSERLRVEDVNIVEENVL